jgi:hypothetical protein
MDDHVMEPFCCASLTIDSTQRWRTIQMAKVIDGGLLPEDDPIFSGSWIIHTAPKARPALNARYEARYGDPGNGRAKKVTEAAEKERSARANYCGEGKLNGSLSKGFLA